MVDESPRIICLFHRGFKLFPRGYKQIEALSDAGYDVKVLCTTRSELPKHGKHEGVEIRRVRTPWPEFPPFKPFALVWVLFVLLIKGLMEDEIDVFHCFGIYTLVPGVFLARLKSTSLTYDAFEDYRYQLEHSGALPVATDLFGQGLVHVECLLASFADAVFVVPSADDILEKRFEDVNTNVTTIWNVPRLSEGISEKQHSSPKTPITVLYVGNISARKGAREMAETAVETLERSAKPIKFVIIGSRSTETAREMDQIIPSELEERIEFPGFVPYDDVKPFLKSADIAIELNQPTFWNKQSKASSKLFRYMAAQLPIVISNFPGFGEIIRKTDSGVPVDPTDPVGTSRVIVELVDDEQKRKRLGKNGYNAFSDRYNWELEKERFINSFKTTTEVENQS